MTTYRVGVIGTGFAERVQLPGFARHERFELVALAARDPEKTARVAETFGIERWHTDWRAMIEAGELDLISITPPPHLHYDMVMAAFDARLAVLCEKPFALNATEGEAMAARARESGLTAMIDHEFRHLAARRRFGELLQEGYVGEVQRLIVRFHTGWRADRRQPWSWWSDRERGGGLLGAIGSHYFDATRHWLQQEPQRVWGKLNTFVPTRPAPDGEGERLVTADDAFLAVLDLGEGREALFDFAATVQPSRGSRVTAIGSAGTLVIEEDKRLLGGQGSEPLADLDLDLLPRGEDQPWLLAPFLRLLDDLADGLDNGSSPTPNFEDALAHQYFIDAVRRSDESGGWIDYPPSAGAGREAVPSRLETHKNS